MKPHDHQIVFPFPQPAARQARIRSQPVSLPRRLWEVQAGHCRRVRRSPTPTDVRRWAGRWGRSVSLRCVRTRSRTHARAPHACMHAWPPRARVPCTRHSLTPRSHACAAHLPASSTGLTAEPKPVRQLGPTRLVLPNVLTPLAAGAPRGPARAHVCHVHVLAMRTMLSPFSCPSSLLGVSGAVSCRVPPLLLPSPRPPSSSQPHSPVGCGVGVGTAVHRRLPAPMDSCPCHVTARTPGHLPAAPPTHPHPPQHHLASPRTCRAAAACLRPRPRALPPRACPPLPPGPSSFPPWRDDARGGSLLVRA